MTCWRILKMPWQPLEPLNRRVQSWPWNKVQHTDVCLLAGPFVSSLFFFSLYYLRWFKAEVCSESHRILELHWPLQILWFMSSVSVVQGVALSSLNPTQSVYNFSVRMYVCLPLLSFLTQQQQQKFVRKQINSTTSFCK